MYFPGIDYKRVARTSGVVFVALLLGWLLWWHYMRSPWTRDGRVRVELVDVAAQIAGQVTDLKVLDNQLVRKGDVLFIVDPDDYRLALAQAEATVQSRRLDLQIAEADAKRRAEIGAAAAISSEEKQTYQNRFEAAAAALKDAEAARDVAQLNMTRTTVCSPVNGYVTNLHLRIGDYATPGQTKLSVIDSDSFWIAGYFEETKLPRIGEGDYAHVKLMGVGPEIAGHVDSFARGIADANGSPNAGLANVDPIFTWVRLAQRIPVRIAIDHVPDGVKVVAGQTCTIVIDHGRKVKTSLTIDVSPDMHR
jgi:multidrug resistance efflux pump